MTDNGMVGMNVAEIERVGRQLRDVHAASIREFGTQIDRLVGGSATAWLGRDGDAFRSWWPAKRAKLIAIATDLDDYGRVALVNAQQQRTASGGVSGSLGLLPASRSAVPFESRGSGRGTVIEAFYGTTDTRRAEFDEIEIRKLDNGRFVVVLPGVTDLSDAKTDFAKGFVRSGGGVIGVEQGVDRAVNGWYDNPHRDTVRRMEYAMGEARDGWNFVNPYSERVIQQMQAAGIPPGADVMFVGHSYGAYTAMDLAGNPKFNSADGVSEGYHVNVTHVVAAGADTNWKFGDLPPETHALILNNRHDAVFNAEDVLHRDVAPTNGSQLEIDFNNNPLAGLKGAGHHPDNYANWLARADRPDLDRWLDSVGDLYDAPGTAYSVKVPDLE